MSEIKVVFLVVVVITGSVLVAVKVVVVDEAVFVVEVGEVDRVVVAVKDVTFMVVNGIDIVVVVVVPDEPVGVS